jgi:hypothetical protein
METEMELNALLKSALHGDVSFKLQPLCHWNKDALTRRTGWRKSRSGRCGEDKIQGVQKVTQPMEKWNINCILLLLLLLLLLLCLFLIISAENVHHYALHRDIHDEPC